MRTEKFELLAPAGTMDALIAALHNGADAVYLGGKMFNARSSAGNFELREIQEAVRHARLHHAKIYITVNTLLRDDEIPVALEYVSELYAAGVNAVILQDMGLAALLRKAFPNLALHASTQMTVHNSAAAQFLEEQGFARIITERQMTLEELIQIRNTIGIELEVFAHGALCVSYSGQCLMSSLIGGRSGNRGRCAQPCRLEYDLVGSKQGIIENTMGPYLLSTKDLNLSRVLPCLIENGFSGIKIEGRMKRPEYVATVVRIYRTLIDRYYSDPGNYSVTDEEARQLEQIFNRDFTKGFLFGAKGKELMSTKRPNNRGVYIGRVSQIDTDRKRIAVHLEKDLSVGDGVEVWVSIGGRIGTTLEEFSVGGKSRSVAYAGELVTFPLEGKMQTGDRVFRTHDHAMIKAAQDTFLGSDQDDRIPLQAKVTVHQNKAMILELTDPEGNRVREESQRSAEPAKNHALDKDTIALQLERTGNTDYYIAGYEWDVQPDTFLPVSIINDLRRQAISKLDDLLKGVHQPKDLAESLQVMRSLQYSIASRQTTRAAMALPRLAVTVNGLDELEAACRSGADIVYWGGDFLKFGENIPIRDIRSLVESGKDRKIEWGIALPRISKDTELEYILKNIQDNNASGLNFRVANLGQLRAVLALRSQKIWLDYPQHSFNSSALEFYRQQGVSRATLSPELTLDQMKAVRIPDRMELECVIQGQIPAMITEHCPVNMVCTGSESSNGGCSQAYCRSDDFALKDRLDYRFPIITDGKCRTFIMNSKELCLFDNLFDFMNSIFSVLRIDAANRGSSYTEQVVSIYRHWLDRFSRNEPLDQREVTHAKRVLQDLSAGGITKGHYYRGVE